ncbi:hypothetical protein SAMN03159496_03310 [Rhizobium sp. NFR07]|uniref:hypothetical protein n=1 Tax=Rhizobium sp. NFR07 TaxID=1566262 RepID=UPI0008EAF61E|nr:hypothetical protein [Rhizobium sp. NFR07]SFB38545.1 hypothetical protein SAMN03159496_03310 [Rhizobium sp. NFR07]
MIRIAIAFAAFASLALPAFAQTGGDTPPQGSTETVPSIAPDPQSTGTNLPGVDGSATTGSTGDSESMPEERCELPGTDANANPTAEVPSVNGADPTCR